MTQVLPPSVRLSEMALLLDLTERRVQQLADAGIVIRESHGCYRLAESVQGYIAYWRNQALQKQQPKDLFIEGNLALVKALEEESELTEWMD